MGKSGQTAIFRRHYREIPDNLELWLDRLASITAFLRVAEIGSFTAAARRLNLSTTRVSEQVQGLERALGVRLLYRTTRRVSLTEVGHEYYERFACRT